MSYRVWHAREILRRYRRPDVLYFYAPGKCRPNVEAHAQNAPIRQPEVRLRVKCHSCGVGSGTEEAAQPVAQAIILSGGKRFLRGDGGCRNPGTLTKLSEPVLGLRREISRATPCAARAVAHLVVAKRGNQADRESVCETIIHIGERAEVTRMRSAVPSAARIVLAPRSHIVEIGFDQNMSLRQRRRVLQGKFDHA